MNKLGKKIYDNLVNSSLNKLYLGEQKQNLYLKDKGCFAVNVVLLL
jgi:hypothetical protein